MTSPPHSEPIATPERAATEMLALDILAAVRAHLLSRPRTAQTNIEVLNALGIAAATVLAGSVGTPAYHRARAFLTATIDEQIHLLIHSPEKTS